MKIVIAGGSGALGRRLCAQLGERGDEIVVLTRRERPPVDPGLPRVRQVRWDGMHPGPWCDELAGAAVINLAGELVDRRPTPANISLLTDSRVNPTRALVLAASQLAAPVPVWIQASTLAIHGDAGDVLLDESHPPADGPPQMAGVAKAWEAAVEGVNADRLTILRTGIVLDRDSPALDRLVGLTRWGLGGRISTGRQWTSWMHIADWLTVVERLLSPADDEDLTGVVHATSPNPVTNADLMAALRHVVHRPASPPTPAWAVRVGAIALRTDPALALTGRRAIPGRLMEARFEFMFPEIRAALADLVGPR